jgi:hypothetical protein
MWQLPTAEGLSGRVGPKRVQAWVSERVGVEVAPPECMATFEYATTHRSITVTLWTADGVTGRVKTGQWRGSDDLADLPISNLQKRAIALLR